MRFKSSILLINYNLIRRINCGNSVRLCSILTLIKTALLIPIFLKTQISKIKVIKMMRARDYFSSDKMRGKLICRVKVSRAKVFQFGKE